MKRVQSFNIAQAKKDMLLAFLLAVITRAQGDEKVTELSNNQLQALIAAYLLYEELAQRHRMNLLTKDVQDADSWRDANLTKVRAAIRAQLKNPDPLIRQAAELLWKITEEVGRVHDQQFDVETGTLTTYCNDLLGNHLEEVELIGVKSDVEALQAANNNFIKILADRTENYAEYPKGESQKARKAAIDAYRTFVLVIEAKVAEGHGAELAPFIDYLNAEINRLRIALGQGIGSGASDEESGDENIISKYINFIYINGTEVKKWFEVGAPIIAPENTPGYYWKDLPEVMPKRSRTIREVLIEEEKATAMFHFADHREEEIREIVGAILHAPANTDGYIWDPEVPETMPAEDTTYFEVPAVQLPPKFKVTYIKGQYTWMTQEYAAGERIVPPAEPEAFRWVDVPEFMPDHDITIYAQYVG